MSGTNERFSLLAFAETILCTSVSIYAAYYFDCYTHILIGGIFAPFLLLRTERSLSLARNMYYRSMLDIQTLFECDGTQKHSELEKFKFHIFVALACLLIRIVSTIITTWKHPSDAIKSIHINWFYQCFIVNYKSPLEPLPGEMFFPSPREEIWYSRVHLPRDISRFSRIISIIAYTIRPAIYILTSLLVILYIALVVMALSITFDVDYFQWLSYIENQFIFWVLLAILLSITCKPIHNIASSTPRYVAKIPAILYRLSLKSTFVVWAPLLWVLSPVPPQSRDVEEVLDELRNGIVSKVVVAYSTIVLFVFFLKPYLIYKGLNNVFDIYSKAIIIDIYWWHIAALINSLLAITFFVVADIEIRKNKFRQGHDIDRVVKYILYSLVIRRVLSIYIILNTFQYLLAITDIIDTFQFHGQITSF